MRLINCRTLKFESHDDWKNGRTPQYAILSHTWNVVDGEVIFQEYRQYEAWAAHRLEPTLREYREYQASRKQASGRKDWEKIACAIEQARLHGIDYVWIDSCCINKEDFGETGEAINSMFKWYAEAKVCFVNIQDLTIASACVLHDSSIDNDLYTLLSTRHWFKRGWTLQELIAPSDVRFYDKNWLFFGTRDRLSATLSKITKIESNVLASPSTMERGSRNLSDILSNVPVARRMSWASSRVTTKKEDEAYSLLGIFGINMPMLYGEGEHAFIRLQEEIIRKTNDLTIFAWTENPASLDANSSVSVCRGVLAHSPKEFSDAGTLAHSPGQHNNPLFTMTNRGLQIQTRLLHVTGSMLEFMSLNCHEVDHTTKEKSKRGILLQFQGAGRYVRVHPDRLDSPTGFRTLPEKDIYIVKSGAGRKASIPDKRSRDYHWDIQDHHSSISSDTMGSNEFLMSTPTLRPRSNLRDPYKNATTTAVEKVASHDRYTSLLPLPIGDSIRIQVKIGPELVDRTWVAEQAHFHDPSESFITVGIPSFCGFVRFRTKGNFGVTVTDFLLVCGFEGDDDEDEDEDCYHDGIADTDTELARRLTRRKEPWIHLVKATDQIFKDQEGRNAVQARQGALREARGRQRKIALGQKGFWTRCNEVFSKRRRQQTALGQKASRLNFRERLIWTKWNQVYRPRLSMGLAVSATIKAEGYQTMDDDDDDDIGGGEKVYVVRIEARPWYAKRKFAFYVAMLLAVLGFAIVYGINISGIPKVRNTFKGVDWTDDRPSSSSAPAAALPTSAI